jgi:hypothetical protein
VFTSIYCIQIWTRHVSLKDIRTQDLPPPVSPTSNRSTSSTITTTTITVLYSAADATAGLSLDPENFKFWQSISSLAKLSAVSVSSNIKLDNVEVLKSANSNELWSQKMPVIFEAMASTKVLYRESTHHLLHLLNS